MPTYEVTSPDGQTFEVTAPEGASQKEVLAYAQANFDKFTKKDISLGEHVSDIGAGLVSGAGQLLQFPGQLAGLATGAIKEKDFATTGLQGIGKGMQEWAQEHKSAGLKQREAATQAKVQQAEKEGGQWGALKTQLAESLTDPAQLGSFLAEQVPASLPSILAALIPGVGPEAAAEVKAMQIAAKSATTVAAKEAAELALGEAVKKASESAIARGAAASIGTAAVQQGTDVGMGAYQQAYDALIAKKVPPEQAAEQVINSARMAGLGGAAISVLANRLPYANAMERALAGEHGNAGRIIGAGLGALKEIPGEMVEEGGGQFAQNVAARQFNPEQSLTEGVGRAGALAALGAGAMGATVGAVQGRAPEQILPGPVTPAAQQAAETADGKLTAQEPEVQVPSFDGMTPAGAQEPSAMAALTGAPNANVSMMEQARAARAAEEKAAEKQLNAEIKRIRSTDFHADPILNQQIKNRMLADLGVTPEQPKVEAEKASPNEPPKFVEARPVKLTKEQQKPIFTPEEAADMANANEGLKEVNKQIAIAKTQGTDLFNRLKGRLHPEDVVDIAPKEKGGRLNMLASKSGGQMLSNLVADGSLNEFLPPDMRITEPGQDESSGVEYIKEALRNGDTRSFDAKIALQSLERQKEELSAIAKQPKVVREANLEAGRIAAEDAETEGISTDDLIARADMLGVNTNQLIEDVATRTGSLTEEQYHGELRKALSQEIATATQGEEKYMLRNGSEPQIAGADVHAENLGGEVVWQDGELALVRGYSAVSGAPVYIVANGDSRSRVDIEHYKGNLVTPEQKDALVEIKKQLETEDAAKPEKIVKFNQNGFGASQNISPEISGVLSEWKKMLGIDSNIYVTTMADARANAKDFTGVYRAIGSSALNSGTLGVMRRLPNGDYYVAFKDTSSKASLMETMAHELGHIHEQEVFNKADDATKMAIMRDFDKWLASTKNKSAIEHIQSLRARKVGKKFTERLTGMDSKDLDLYWSTFSEWYADQVSRWATTTEKPLTVVEKFFAKLGAAMRAFYAKLRNAKYLPTTTFKKYLDNISKLPEPIVSKSGQMEMFMKHAPEQRMIEMPFGKKEQEPTPTGAGVKSMDILSKLGRANQEADPTAMEKIGNVLKSARDNPKATAEAARQATTNWMDKFETWTFSSDAALNNRIVRGLKEMGKSSAEKLGMLLNASLSQTVHSDAVASLFLQKGGIRYNEELYKWEGVDKDSNFVKLSKQLDDLASKNGLTKQQAELVAHTAFEAKRLRSMVRFNEELSQKIDDIKREAAAKRATSPVAASALSEKAARMKQQFKYISDSQLAMIAPGMELFKIHPELNDVVKTWNEIRSNAVDTLVQTGLWSQEDAEEMLSNADYVPFYREEQLEQNKGPKEFIRGLQVQAREHRLKGSDRPVNDIFDNQVRWVQYSINRAVRNRSALALADTAVEVGAAKKLTEEQRKGAPNVVRAWRNGKEEFFSMDDPMFVDAFTGLEAIVIPSWKWASSVANMLRQSVVMYPLFSVAQVPQDSFAAMFSSGLKPQFALRIPVLAVKEFVQTLRGASRTHEELKNVGAVGVRDFTSAMVRMDAEIYAGLKAPPGVLGKVKYALNHIAMSADNAVRQAVYEASMAQGLSRAEAMEKAFDVFNVRRKGSSKSLALAGQMIPFFSAYLAAQNVAYKTITGRGISPTERQEAFKTLAATTASVMVLSLLYAMMNGDDDDYLKKPATQRDRLLMVPGTGGFSIPLRADLFTMPKIITEHTYLMMTDKGYEDGRKFRDSMNAALGSALLSPTVVPQAIKPLVEVGINYDFFQGRPLIGTYQQKLETERQFTDSTSEMAKILGSTGVLSPIAIDHLIRGMFGSVGGLVLYATNPMLHSDPNSPRPSLSERDAIAALPGMSGFMTKSYESALKKDFYTLKEEVDKAANTMNDLKTRSPYEIEGFLAKEENLSRLGLQKSVNAIGEKLSNIRKAVTQISNSNMPADEKREQLKMLREAENEMLKGVDVKALRQLGKI